eukprot:Skav201647  [mRNA]  locus=scaffold3160:62523:67889:+ [translate_table: standard]
MGFGLAVLNCLCFYEIVRGAKSGSDFDEIAALQLVRSEPEVQRQSEVFYYPLPTYLQVLNESDPDFSQLQKSAEKYALNMQPGKGGVLDYQIVKNTEGILLHRVWGAPAKQCGYWWTLPHSLAIAPDSQLTLPAFMEAMGVCPEWNNGTFLEICRNLVGKEAMKLQVNGDVCSQSLICRTCNLRTHFNLCWAQIKDGSFGFAADIQKLHAERRSAAKAAASAELPQRLKDAEPQQLCDALRHAYEKCPEEMPEDDDWDQGRYAAGTRWTFMMSCG